MSVFDNFKERNELIERLDNGTATEEEITQEISNFMEYALKTRGGTLQNYPGKVYIDKIMELHPNALDVQWVNTLHLRKKNALGEYILERFLDGKNPNTSDTLMFTKCDYIEGKLKRRNDISPLESFLHLSIPSRDSNSDKGTLTQPQEKVACEPDDTEGI